MLKQSFIFLILSIVLVIFARYVHMLIVYVDMIYAYFNVKLSPMFTHLELGPNLSKIILLVLIPLTMAGVPALSYRLIRGKDMPYFMESIWCIWLVVILSNVLIQY